MDAFMDAYLNAVPQRSIVAKSSPPFKRSLSGRLGPAGSCPSIRLFRLEPHEHWPQEITEQVANLLAAVGGDDPRRLNHIHVQFHRKRLGLGHEIRAIQESY